MIKSDDVLPLSWKFYIAIMAVSCYDCEYLIKILEDQFLLVNGDIDWLTQGLKSVDPKLQRISKLNEIMAYQAWRLNENHIKELVKGEEDGTLNWTVHQVLKAGVILAYYHSLCGFVYG